MASYTLKILLLNIFFILMLNSCAKSQGEKELKISDNNISIRLEATVYPMKRQDIISSAAGKIKHLYIKYGTKVTKGMLLYSLDKELILLDIENKKAEISSLKKIRASLISSTRNPLNSADVNLAAIELKKISSLKAEGYVQDFEQDNYKRNYINTLNAQKSQEKSNYERLKTLNATLTTKEIELKKLQYQLQHANGYADIDGFIANIKVQEGETISSDKKIATIINLDRVIVKAGFAPGLLPFIHVDQPADISFVTTPPYSVHAKVDQITPIVNPSFDSMTLDIIVPNQSYILQEGTRALVTINLSKEGQERVRQYFMNDKRERIIEIKSEI